MIGHEPKASKHWSFMLSSSERRICHQGARDYLLMYRIFFYEIRVRLPFTPFEVVVINHLELAPTQLHPNGWGFVRSFQILCKGLGLEPSVNAFFCLFQPLGSSKTRKNQNLVTFRSIAGKQIEVFQDSLKGFKYKYFFLVPLTRFSKPQLRRKNGKKRFPLWWSDKHFNWRASDYGG